MQNSLFGSNYSNGNNILKPKSAEPISKKEKLNWEKQLLGLYISGHPLDEYIDKIRQYKVMPIKEITATAKKNPISSFGFKKTNNKVRVAGVISSIKRIVSKNGQPMLFVKIEDFNSSAEIIVFSDALSKNPTIWRENNILVVEGQLSWRDDEPKIICQSAIEIK